MTLSTHWRQALAGAALFAATAAQAVGVSYLATDLADTTPGQDLWAIDYTVSGPLANFESINLLFSPDLYGEIGSAVSGNPSALEVAPPVQPDAGNVLDGFVGITALADHAAGPIGIVNVSFVWLGAGRPGAQTFEILDTSFNVVGTAQTVAGVVPEPAAAWLMVAGLAAVGTRAARRRAR